EAGVRRVRRELHHLATRRGAGLHRRRLCGGRCPTAGVDATTPLLEAGAAVPPERHDRARARDEVGRLVSPGAAAGARRARQLRRAGGSPVAPMDHRPHLRGLPSPRDRPRPRARAGRLRGAVADLAREAPRRMKWIPFTLVAAIVPLGYLLDRLLLWMED